MKRAIITGAIVLALAATANADAQVVYRRSAPTAYLGISFGEIVERTADSKKESIKVQEISKDSPAEKAGMKVGDEILRVNGMAATNGKFGALASTLAVGDTVKLRIARGGSERDITIVAAPRPAGYGSAQREIIVSGDSVRRRMRDYLDSARVHLDGLNLPSIRVIPGDSTTFDVRISPYRGMMPDSIFLKRDSAMVRLFRSRPGEGLLPPDVIWESDGELGPGRIFHSMELGRRSIAGAEFNEMDAALAEYFNGQRGLLTLRVVPETPAERAGLQAGDVVLKANDRAVKSVQELRSIIATNPDGVKLEVSRKGKTRTVEIKTKR
jgi:membrane-associated protease RseP (regulator of RpoE activity)